jgi:hypothetical protein
MFEIPEETLLDIASDYGVDIDKVNRFKELLSGSQLIGDEEELCRVLSAALDISNPIVMPEGLKMPEEMDKPLTEREILEKALIAVYDSEDPRVISADVEGMLSAAKVNDSEDENEINGEVGETLLDQRKK